MKKQLITTMCGAIIFTSMFGGSFASTKVNATEVKTGTTILPETCISIDGTDESCIDLGQPQKWDDFKTMLNLEKATKDEVKKLEGLYNKAVAEEKKLYDSKKELEEKDFEQLDKIWDEFWKIADKYFDDDFGVDIDDEFEPFEPETWKEFKEIFSFKEMTKTQEAELEGLYNAAVKLDETIFGGTSEPSDADYDKSQGAWDKFWDQAEQHLDESDFDGDFEDMDVMEAFKWEDFQSMLKKDANEKVQAQIKGLFDVATKYEKALFEKAETEISDAQFDELFKLWDKVYEVADVHLNIDFMEGVELE